LEVPAESTNCLISGSEQFKVTIGRDQRSQTSLSAILEFQIHRQNDSSTNYTMKTGDAQNENQIGNHDYFNSSRLTNYCGMMNKCSSDQVVRPRLREDLVIKDMSVQEIKALLGDPDRIIREPENRLEAWTYYENRKYLKDGHQLGGLTIVIRDDRVFDIMTITIFQYY
jgi:hypothetical protein